MAQRPSAVAQVRESAEQLISDYGLQLYADRIHEVAQEAVQAVLNEWKGEQIDTPEKSQRRDAQIFREAKRALRDLLTRWQKDAIASGVLGGMQLYKVWGAELHDGKEWFFYPDGNSKNPHVSWVFGSQEVHVKFDPGKDRTPATLYYDAQLHFTRVGRHGQQPTSQEQNQANEIIENWRTAMLTQSNQRRAIAEFLS